MIGGMVSSTVLTLIVIPAVYGLVKGWRLPRASTTTLDTKPTNYRQFSNRPAE
jgi:Cu(I)/Ag(I) efflux system membrane protein CusA/SilA